MGITKHREVYKPFEYQEGFDYWEKAQGAHWSPFEVPMTKDVTDWRFNLTDAERNVVGGILKSFTQTEIHVNDYWAQRVTRWFPKPEICMMASSFANMESIHTVAYAYLNDSLGLDEWDAFLKEPTSMAKLERLQDVKGNSKRDIARSLAIFSGCTEGVSLFSSFAVLMSFSRLNLLDGVDTIVSWSIRDECHSPETEVLTEHGWKRIDSYMTNTKIAVFDPKTNKVKFEYPKRYHTSYIDSELYNLHSEKDTSISQRVTKGHRIIYRDSYNNKPWTAKLAKEFKPHSNYSIPISGILEGVVDNFSFVDRFFVASQADGTDMRNYRENMGVNSGKAQIKFNFIKDRKKERLEYILSNLKSNGFSYTKNEVDGDATYYVSVPLELFVSRDPKNFKWIDLTRVSGIWCKHFIDEVLQWDGSIRKDCDSYYYSSINKENVELVQTIAHLCGMSATLAVQMDERKETYNDVYRLFIQDKSEKKLGRLSVDTEQYKGNVYCFETSTGAFLIRHNGRISVSGNSLHSQAGCWLFRQLVEENPEIMDDDFKKDIYDAFRLTIKLEDDFIDEIFSKGSVRNLDPNDIKVMLRERANSKLHDLGLGANWKRLDQDALDRMSWFEEIDQKSSDFFAKRVTAYFKSNFTIDNLFPEEYDFDKII